MKNFLTLRLAPAAVILLIVAAWFVPFETIAGLFNDDPDIPDFIKKAKSKFSKEEYRAMRSHQFDLYRGMTDGDKGEKLRLRGEAILEMGLQEDAILSRPAS